MVQIVLIRPGSTDYDAEGRIQGTLDIPLNEHGTDEVQRIVREVSDLGISTIYCCPCQSAVQTAGAIAEALGLKIKKLETLRNIDHGLWQGMLVEDVKRRQPRVYRQLQEQPASVCPPEGETLNEAEGRVQAALTKLLKKHKEGTVALVVPEPLASVVHHCLAHCEIGHIWKGLSHCGTWEVIPTTSESAVS